jgi:hypothetical protein
MTTKVYLILASIRPQNVGRESIKNLIKKWICSSLASYTKKTLLIETPEWVTLYLIKKKSDGFMITFIDMFLSLSHSLFFLHSKCYKFIEALNVLRKH